MLILAMCYWLARRLMNEEEAGLATALILLNCAFNRYYCNYFQPYSYAALYGFVFALCALVCAVSYLQRNDSRWMLWAGISTGLVIICKPELGALASAPVGVAWLVVCLHNRHMLWRAALIGVSPVVVISGVTYGLILRQTSWQTLFTDNYRLLSAPQLVYFSRLLSGALDWPQSLLNVAKASANITLVTGSCALAGIIAAKQWKQMRRAWRVWGLLLGGLLLERLFVGLFNTHIYRGFIQSAPLILLIIIAILTWRWWRYGIESLTQTSQILLILSVFSVIAIARMFLNVSLSSAYTPFTLPTVIIIFLWLLFRCAPGLLLIEERLCERARICTVIFASAVIAALTILYALEYRRLYTFEIGTSRGHFFIGPDIGRPMAEAIRHIQQHTAPDDEALVLPQGTGLNFLTGRRYPLREECIVPGLVEGERETAVIERLAARRVPVVVIFNLWTPEYRDRAFGVDYNQDLVSWIEEHYRLVATFGSQSDRQARLGDKEMFFSVYERNK